MALVPAATAAVDCGRHCRPWARKPGGWRTEAQRCFRMDLPLDGTGAADFKAVVKAKLGALPRVPPAAAPAARVWCAPE